MVLASLLLENTFTRRIPGVSERAPMGALSQDKSHYFNFTVFLEYRPLKRSEISGKNYVGSLSNLSIWF